MILQDPISQIQNGVKNLKKQLLDLQKQNKESELKLEERDENAESQAQPKSGRRGGLSNAALKSKVQKLEEKVSKLEKVSAIRIFQDSDAHLTVWCESVG